MKKIIIIILSFLPVFVKANDYIKINCPTFNVGDEITCDVTGHTDFAIKALEYKYNVPSNITIKEFIKDDIWEGTNLNNTIYLYTNKSVNNDYNIGKIVIVVNSVTNEVLLDDINLTYTDDTFYDHNMLDVKSVENTIEDDNKKSYYGIIIIGTILIIVIILLIIICKRRKII